MNAMTAIEAQGYIDECRRQLHKADEHAHTRSSFKDQEASYSIGALILAIDQLAAVVEDLANREQGRRTA